MAKILMIGCGNSPLSEEMYDQGYKNIISIDISGIVIDQMQTKADKDGRKLVYLEMDATNMSF